MSSMPDSTHLSDSVADRVRRSFDAQSMMKTLGASLEHLAPGTCRITAPILPGSRQQQGFAHAALTFALGDSASGYAALTLMPDDSEVVTTEMKINLLAPAQGDRLVAEGRVIKPGRRLLVTQATVWAEAGGERRQVAVLLGSMMPVPL